MNKNIVIPNLEKLERIKKAISEDGVDKLHILADFDRTLTYAFTKGGKVHSIISILRSSIDYLGEEYVKKAYALHDKYYPIEIDPKIPLERKKTAMREWWKLHSELVIKSGLNRSHLKKVAISGKIKFRQGVLDFFDFLNQHKIPLIIMSSNGLGGDVISMYLKHEAKFYDNVHIICNSFEWDKDGNAVRIKEPIIHCMNKDETVIREFPAFDIIKDRNNVLLLGDNLEDVGMIKGFDYNNLIKIGFLNENVEENLKHYSKAYDILILNDSSMDYVNELLKEIIL